MEASKETQEGEQTGESIKQVLEEVTFDINNGKENFVRISEEEVPEFLKFIEEQNNFSEWAVIGQGKKEDKEEGIEEKEEKLDEPTSLSSSMILRNLEEQLKLVREERERQWKEQHDSSIQPPPEEPQQTIPLPQPSIPPTVNHATNPSEEDPLEGEETGEPIEKPQSAPTLPEQFVPLEHLQWRTDTNLFSSFIKDDSDRILLDDWVWIEDLKNEGNCCQELVRQDACCTPAPLVCRTQPGFFENWPSFGVYDKMKVVILASGSAFCFGFVMGAQMAMESLYKLIQSPVIAGGVSLAAALAVYTQPTMIVTAIEYIVFGGVVFGTAIATPVLVVGTGGVFVGATLYHSYIAAKRGGGRVLQATLGTTVNTNNACCKQIDNNPQGGCH